LAITFDAVSREKYISTLRQKITSSARVSFATEGKVSSRKFSPVKVTSCLMRSSIRHRSSDCL
jgi:hypothetical protein